MIVSDRQGGAFVAALEPLGHLVNELLAFRARKLLGEEVESWPIEDALTTLRIIEAVFASARDGQWREL